MGQTLEQLENDVWESPELATTMIRNCYRLRKKPIDEFTIGDLRLMIGQDIGTEYLMPQAIEILEADPLAEGDLYPGELLHSVMTLPIEYWKKRPDQANKAREIALEAIKILKRQEDIDSVDEKLIKRTEQFLAQTAI
jgi:CDI immunity proteins